jgi:hypothetical protein
MLNKPTETKEEKRMRKAGGVLTIIGGILAIIAGAIGIGWGAIVGAGFIVLGIVALIGGICALRRRLWGLALAGAICAVALRPYAGDTPLVLGILAVIFVSLGKKEFE